jgi:putative FmdB family regulatory protein
MPLYEYKCDACGRRFELIQRFSDPPAETCSVCGSGPVQKQLSSPAIQFKGSGWYITDYAKKQDQKGEAQADAGSGGEAGGKEKPAKAKGETPAKSGAAAEKTASPAGTTSAKE